MLILVSTNPLLESLYREPDETLHAVVKRHLEDGQDPNVRTRYWETPLKQAFRRGRMDVFALLLEHGADLTHMRWSPLHQAVALGGLAEVRSAAEEGDLSARDVEGLTPFLLACDIGDVDKAAFLLPLSRQEDLFRTYQRQPALTVAAEKGRDATVRWLLANGFDVNEADEFGGTALIAASERGNAEIVKTLLDAGADIGAKLNLSAAVKDIDREALDLQPPPPAKGDREFLETAARKAASGEVARLLIAAGAQPDEIDKDVLRELTGATLIPEQKITPAMFQAQKHRRFGTRNPEPVAYEFWLEMIRTGMSAFCADERFGPADFSTDESPIWCFDRFGMSTTEAPGGVWVQVAGEHEDFYDPEFCIYNDVIVHDGKGNAQIYIYPREVFPPTDFHTATMVGDAIVLIGNLGYTDERRAGYTQVMRLDLNDFSIERVEASGDLPGWISRHRARLDGERIVVWDGEVWDGSAFDPTDGAYEFCLATGDWRRLLHE